MFSPFEGLFRPFEGLLSPFEGLLSPFEGLFSPFEGLFNLFEGLRIPCEELDALRAKTRASLRVRVLNPIKANERIRIFKIF